MADFCLDCLNEIECYEYTEEQVQLSEPNFCGKCWQKKPLVLEIKE